MVKRKARTPFLIAGVGFIVYFLYINRPIILSLIEISGLSTAVLYDNAKSISNDMEAAPFNRDGFHYLVSVRTQQELNKNGFRIFDVNHKQTSFFQTNSVLPSALAVGDDLVVTATNDDHENKQSRIQIFRFEKGNSHSPHVQTVIASSSTIFFNSSLAHDTQRENWILAYEIDEPGLTPFSIRFLKWRIQVRSATRLSD